MQQFQFCISSNAETQNYRTPYVELIKFSVHLPEKTSKKFFGGFFELSLMENSQI
jgi:hypothetical protein